MDRLAKYVEKFAALLGSEANVHLLSVEKSSCALRAFADDPAVPKIRDRANRINDGTAPRSALKAKAEMDDLLAQDNAIGEVYIDEQKVIEFPGRRRRVSEEIGPVARRSTIDGQIFSIGGKDETINVQLRNGDNEFRCVVSVELARKLGRYLLGRRVRLTGSGYWYRTDGHWRMASFTAETVSELDESPLGASLERIQAILSDVSPKEFMATMEDLRSE